MPSLSVQPPCHADLVFVNPAAGGGRAIDALAKLQAYAESANWNADFRVTSDALDLGAQARAAEAAGQQRILILGGDGSFQDLLNALVDFPEAVLGILPAGCGNDLASSLGLPLDPVRAAQLLGNAEIYAMDAVRVTTADGKQRLYTGGGGVGLDAEASYIAATEYPKLSGRLRYLLSAARAYSKYQSLQIRINIEPSDGTAAQNLAAKVLLLGVLNTPSYGAGLRFAPRAQTNDGILDLVLVEDLPFIELLFALPRLILQGEVRSHRVKHFLVRKVTIETDFPCRVHGDGEILGFTPVQFEVVPRAIRVLRPLRSSSRSKSVVVADRLDR